MHTNTKRRTGAAGLFVGLAVWACGNAALAAEPIEPLPLAVELDAARVALGKKLFNDKRLSRDDTIACASCHRLDGGGVDNAAVSTGIDGAKGSINAPTVFNSGFNFRQFWDGRARSLEEQAAGPIHNPIEMGSDWQQVLAKLRQDPGLVAQADEAYPGGLSADSVVDAIATFERSLITPSPFDRYLRGDTSAIGQEAAHGYELFKNYGCVACHQGVNVGGNMFQVFGVMGDYFAKRGGPTKADLGRYNVTGLEADKHVFKVPSLRNVALTAPYFHDGSASTLDDAVDVMFRYQLGRSAPAQDKALIVKFLRSLTGDELARPLIAAR